jgi:hypothetical protein
VTRTKLADTTAALAAALMLLAPALWNGFPLLEYDSGGYLARWFEGTLEVSRSTVYGLFLVVLARPDFWPVIVAQAAATVWVITLVLRAHGLGGRPLVLLGTVATLAIATTLPWIASILLTDIFAGVGVLALYLLVLRSDLLAGWERPGLIALAAFAAASHGATLAVLLVLLGAAIIVSPFNRKLVPPAGLASGIAALTLGPVVLLTANYAVAGRLAWTPGGIALPFGRMLQDGIVARFLADHCPDPRFKLCDHRAELPADADEYFWGDSIFDRLGRFQGLNDEMRTIVLESMRDYPLWQIEAAANAAIRQLVHVRTGEGVIDSIWHTHGMIENFAPSALPAMWAARQQKGEFGFGAINRLHVPVALASMVLLLGTIVLASKQPRFADLGPLAATAALAILANAAVCGVLANPHDRYGVRLVWIASLVVMLVPWRVAVPAWRAYGKPVDAAQA